MKGCVFMKKKILSILTALVLAVGVCPLVASNASAAVQRIDRTGGRDDGTWLFPLDQAYFNCFTDWAGCLNGYCKLCGGNHANDGTGDPYHSYGQFNGAGHNGFDVGASYGAKVMAAASGTVRAASWNGSRGLTVIIEHPVSGSNMSYYSYYQHLSAVDVSVGQSVSAGSIIGKVGNSGGDYGTHLHFGMVLAEKNCDIVSALYGIECSSVLTKTDGYSKRGIVLVNPSVNSVFPGGYNGVTNSVASHSGSVSYTFDKSKVKIGGASAPVQTQSFDTIADGTYFLYNRATNLALNLGWNNDANCENVHAYEYSTTNRGELMSITSCSSDGKTYKIRPIDAKRLVQMYGEIPYNGVNVCIYSDLANSSQWWRFIKSGNGYAILIDCDTNYALSSVSGDAVLTTYTGAGNQIWELIFYNATYTVNYNANGGSGSMASETFSVGRNSNLSANKFTRSGYTFQGWAKSAGATSADYLDKAVVADLAGGKTSVTLYAVWKADPVSTYTINYDGNGNTSGYMNSAKVTCNTSVNLQKNSFKRFGYRFLGWSTNKSATTAQYKDGQSVKNLAQSSEVTLYAVWEYIDVPQLNGLKVTKFTANSVSLAWDSVNVDGYEIWIDDVYFGKVTSNSFTATGLKPATAYKFSVYPYIEGASCSVGQSVSATTDSGVAAAIGTVGAESIKDYSTSKPDAAPNTSSASEQEVAADDPTSLTLCGSSPNTSTTATTSKPSSTTSSSTSTNTSAPSATSKPSSSTTSNSSTNTSVPATASNTNTPPVSSSSNTPTNTPVNSASSADQPSVSKPNIETNEPTANSEKSNGRDNSESTSTASQTSADDSSGKNNNAAQTAGIGAVISSSIFAFIHFLKKFFGK